LSIGGVYWYFKSKDEIVFSILEQVFQSDLQDLNSLLILDAPTAERVRTYVAQYVKHYDDYSWLDPIGIQFYAESVHDAKTRSFIRKYLAHYRQALAALIEQGIQRGEFRLVAGRPLDVANSILGLEEGLSMLAVADPQNVRWKETFQTSIELILIGLTKKETEK